MSYATYSVNAIVDAPAVALPALDGSTISVEPNYVAVFADSSERLAIKKDNGFVAALNMPVTQDTVYSFPTGGPALTLVDTTVASLPSLATVGTITTGQWQAGVISPAYGGTGVNNGSSTITLGGSLTTAGAFPLTVTTTAATNVTLPTSGTLVNDQVATLSNLSSIGTITTGTWNASTIGVQYGGTGATTLTQGGLLYGNGTSPVGASAAGSSGQLLVSGGTGAPTWSGTITYASNKLTGLAAPTLNSDAANKQYVDETIAGLSWKQAARASTTAPLTVTYDNGVSGVGATLTNAGAQAALVIDGVTLAVNNRVLVKDQASALQNGIYIVSDIGSVSTNWVLTRSVDTDNSPATELDSAAVFVSEGTAGANKSWVQTTASPVVGTSPIAWSQFAGTNTYTASNGVQLVGNDFRLATLTDGQILIGSTGLAPVPAQIAGTVNRVTVTNGAGSITLSGPQDIHTGASPTFVSQNLTATSNQLVLGTTNTVTLSAAAPAASSTYVIPDVGTSSQFLMTAGTQTITGNKTMSGTLNMSALTASKPLLLDGSNNVISGDVSLTSQVTGILPIANGGTATSTVPTNGQLLIGNGTGYAVSTLTAGAGVTITNGAGTITIASSAATAPQTLPFFNSQFTVTNTAASTIAFIPHDHARFGSYTTRQVRLWVLPGSVDRTLTVNILPNGGASLGSITVPAGGAADLFSFTFTNPGADTRLDFSVQRANTANGTSPIIYGATLEYL